MVVSNTIWTQQDTIQIHMMQVCFCFLILQNFDFIMFFELFFCWFFVVNALFRTCRSENDETQHKNKRDNAVKKKKIIKTRIIKVEEQIHYSITVDGQNNELHFVLTQLCIDIQYKKNMGYLFGSFVNLIYVCKTVHVLKTQYIPVQNIKNW